MKIKTAPITWQDLTEKNVLETADGTIKRDAVFWKDLAEGIKFNTFNGEVKTGPVPWRALADGIEILIPEKEKPLQFLLKNKKFWQGKVTIYNDVAETAVEPRHFDRFVISKCNIQGGRVSKADGTIENVVNAKSVWTKDVERYREPRAYALLPADERENYFTVQIGDFVVLGEVEDVVENAKDFLMLQQKYSNFGFKVTSISPNLFGTAVDNVSFTNA